MFGSSRAVGLYIDSKSIFVANIQMQGQTAKIIGSAEIAVPGTSAGVEINKATADAITNALLQSQAAQSKNVFLAIPGEGSMIRSFELPLLPKKEQKDAVRFEARKYVPFDLKDLYFDSEIFENVERKRMSVVFFAAKKSLVDDLVGLLKAGNIQVNSIELSSQSIIRAFNYETSHNSDEVYAIIQAGDDKTAEIIIARKQSVMVTRHVAFTKLPDTLGGMDLAPFISEIRLSFDYFSENFKNDKISKLYIRTGGSKDSLKRLHETLRQEFTLPVEIASTPLAAMDTPRSPGMNTAFGLALRGLWDTKTKKIDLSPPKKTAASVEAAAPELPWEEQKKLLQEFAIKEIFVLAAILLVVFLYLSSQLNAKKAQVNQLRALYPKSQTSDITSSAQGLYDKSTELNGKLGFLTQLIDKRVYVTTKLNEIIKAVPTDIKLTRLIFDESVGSKGLMGITLRLEGSVSSGDVITAVDQLSISLKKSKDFMQGLEDIKASSISSERKTFTLDCLGSSRRG